MKPQNILVTGSVFCLLAVLLGAFGAHLLKPMLSQQALQWWNTAWDYQVMHGFAVIFLGLLNLNSVSLKLVQSVFWSFVFGILLFSGSLYLMAVTGYKALAILTPVGGVLFLIGWVLLIVSLARKR